MRKIKVWKLVADSLHREIPVMLLYVLESKGSSPGRQGFHMAVNAAGEMDGSVGGGIMEHKLVELAKEKLQDPSFLPQLKKQVHDKSAAANQSGMICSGEQTIWTGLVKKEDRAAITALLYSLETHGNGTLQLSPAGISFIEKAPEQDFSFHFQSEDDWLYTEKTGCKNTLVIVGGGHCSLALSELMRPMNFYIHVLDDRPGLKTMEENSAAHTRQVIGSYSELSAHIPPGPAAYVVIMTFGYRTDEEAMRALANHSFRYLGILGSQKKMAKLLDAFRQEGMDEAWLQRIHTPIGLAINSRTPEEIAVSIAAEIIREKNKTP